MISTNMISLLERKEIIRGRFLNYPNHPNLVIREAKHKRVRFQNADRLVNYCGQQDALIVSVVSLYGTYLGGRCSSA